MEAADVSAGLNGPDDSGPYVPIIPWERQDEFGRWGAYWKTVWYVLRRNGRLEEAMAGPVDYKLARKFRWRTVKYVMLPTVGTVGLGLVIGLSISGLGYVAEGRHRGATSAVFLATIFGAVAGLVACAGCLLGLTGIVRLFFAPRHLGPAHRDRAISLSYYTCAPMLLLPLALVLIVLALPFLSEHVTMYNLRQWLSKAWIAPAVFASAVVVYWYQLILRAAQSVACRRLGGMVLTAVAVPLLWAVMTAMTWLLPVAIAMWLLMAASLT